MCVCVCVCKWCGQAYVFTCQLASYLSVGHEQLGRGRARLALRGRLFLWFLCRCHFQNCGNDMVNFSRE